MRRLHSCRCYCCTHHPRRFRRRLKRQPDRKRPASVGLLGAGLLCGGGYVISSPSRAPAPAAESDSVLDQRLVIRRRVSHSTSSNQSATVVRFAVCATRSRVQPLNPAVAGILAILTCRAAPASAGSRRRRTSTATLAPSCSRSRSRCPGRPVLADHPVTGATPVDTTELCRDRDAGLPGHEWHHLRHRHINDRRPSAPSTSPLTEGIWSIGVTAPQPTWVGPYRAGGPSVSQWQHLPHL